MIFKIYIIVSIITFVLFASQIISIIDNLLSKYDKCITINEHINVAGIVMQAIKIFILSFLPFVNLLLCILLLFCGNKINSRIEEMILGKTD